MDRRAFVGLGAVGTGIAAAALTATPAGATPPSDTMPVFDVTAFGAVGDGSTSNVAAFQSVQTAVRDNGGGTIYFPPGDYLAAPLPTGGAYKTMAEHLYAHYTGLGRTIASTGAFHEAFAIYTSNTTLLFAPGARLVHQSATAQALVFIIIGACSNVSILGGELVGSGPYVDSHDVIGIRLLNAERVQIRNMTMTELRADGVRVEEYHRWVQPDPPDPQYSQRVVITGCRFESCKKQSLLLRAARDVSVVGNSFIASGGHGEHIGSIDFEDHDVWDPVAQAQTARMLVEHQRFVGNIIAGTTDHGVVVSGRNPQPGIVIAENQAVDNGKHGLFLGQSAVTFGNTASQNVNAGIGLEGSRAVDQVVVANTLVANGGYGLNHRIDEAGPPVRSDKRQRDNVVVANRAAGNTAGQIRSNLAYFEHDDLQDPLIPGNETAWPGSITTNLVADNLEVP